MSHKCFIQKICHALNFFRLDNFLTLLAAQVDFSLTVEPPYYNWSLKHKLRYGLEQQAVIESHLLNAICTDSYEDNTNGSNNTDSELSSITHASRITENEIEVSASSSETKDEYIPISHIY